LGYNVYMTNVLTENKAEGKNFPVRSNNKNARKPAKNGSQGKRTTDRQQTKPDKRAPGFDRSAKSKSDKRLAVGRAPETAYPLAYAPDETRGARQKKPDKNEKVKIIFLGGVGEIGKNLTAFEYADEIVVIDAGLTFPTDEMPGIDTVIPDITYLKENREKVKAVFLTHGHEDHIGAVPYLLRQIDAPVYGSKLTLGLLSNKLTERRVEGDLREIRDGQTVRTKYFSAEFIHVCHSVAGSMAIALRTPVGTIFHTGDFKIDYTPIGGESMNLNRFAEIGNEGVLLLLAESTNVERPGYTMSEVVVTSTLRKLFVENADRRIIIATFASNVDRVQQILELASEFKRKVALGGRSMLKVIETAIKAGILHCDPRLFIDVEKAEKLKDEEVVILATGTQGEPMSALTRMSSNDFNKIRVGANDTIIISASPIPGNEKDITKVINNLYRMGAVVIYSSLADVHVSGHACQEELKLIHSLLKPKFFMPVHGEYRHQKQHARLAANLGMPEDNIIIPEIGNVVLLSDKKMAVKGNVTSGIVLIDGLGIGDVGDVLLRDRIALSEEGILIVLVGVDTTQGVVSSGPEVISRGCIYTGDDSNNYIIEEIKTLSLEALEKLDLKELNISDAKQLIQRAVKGFLKRNLQRYPMIIPIILET